MTCSCNEQSKRRMGNSTKDDRGVTGDLQLQECKLGSLFDMCFPRQGPSANLERGMPLAQRHPGNGRVPLTDAPMSKHHRSCFPRPTRCLSGQRDVSRSHVRTGNELQKTVHRHFSFWLSQHYARKTRDQTNCSKRAYANHQDCFIAGARYPGVIGLFFCFFVVVPRFITMFP